MSLTYEEVFELLSYDPQTGSMFWKVWTQNQVTVGDVAGWTDRKGYRAVKIRKNGYMQHRIAWLLHYGSWPEKQVDHINGKRDDNRICNLRAATNSQNQMNRKKGPTNTSGYKGISFNKREQKYQARATLNGKRFSFGYFSDPKDAHQAYIEGAAALYKEFFNAG